MAKGFSSSATNKRHPVPGASEDITPGEFNLVVTNDGTPIQSPRKKRATVPKNAVASVEQETESEISTKMSVEDTTRFYLSNEKEAGQFYTRSLDLFEDGSAISEITEELLLKKSSERVRFVRPLKLLQRQIHNVLLFVARPHMSTQDTFSVSLDYLNWMAEHNHNDKSYVKNSIEDMQQALMQISDGAKWFSTQLLHDVLIDGKVLYFKIPPLLKKFYSAPERYYHVSMRMNSRFKSKYGHALYELLRENLWRRTTGDIPLQEFRERMSIQEGEYTEFKRLTARVIVPALAELEEISDCYGVVKYISHGRKVVALNFSIHENTKNVLGSKNDINLDEERFTILREEFGIASPKIREITRDFRIKRIEEVTDVLFFRYILKKKPVKNALSLILKALNDTEDRYFLTSTEKAELALFRERKNQKTRQSPADALDRPNVVTPAELFNNWWPHLNTEKQAEIWGVFLQDAISQPVIGRKKYSKAVPDVSHPLVAAALQAFVVRERLLPLGPFAQ